MHRRRSYICLLIFWFPFVPFCHTLFLSDRGRSSQCSLVDAKRKQFLHGSIILHRFPPEVLYSTIEPFLPQILFFCPRQFAFAYSTSCYYTSVYLYEVNYLFIYTYTSICLVCCSLRSEEANVDCKQVNLPKLLYVWEKRLKCNLSAVIVILSVSSGDARKFL